ncbi:MAG: type II toxin-antitoxin system RelE/ParE family toxin [Rhodoplanes sp.]
MIENFRHKGLRRLFEQGDAKALNPQHVDKIETILGLLDVAQKIEDMNVHSFRLHPLTGDLKGFWSVTVRPTGASSFGSRTAKPPMWTWLTITERSRTWP